jgi:hypothetical protein
LELGRRCGIRYARVVGQWDLGCHVTIAVFYRVIYSGCSKLAIVAESAWLGKRGSIQQAAA